VQGAGRRGRAREFGRRFIREVEVRLGVDIPVGDRYYGAKATDYDETRRASPTWQWEYEVVSSLLADVPAGSRVLDVPFGSGRFTPLYRDHGLQVTGIDSSADMLVAARRMHGDAVDGFDLAVGDATRLAFPTGHFDLSLCFRFLPGIVTARQARATLRELARVTRERAFLQFKHRDTHAPRRWHDGLSRLGPQSPGQLQTLLQDAGFTVDDVLSMPGTNRVVYCCTPRHPR
jgi:SAM-dependent methyltransferase